MTVELDLNLLVGYRSTRYQDLAALTVLLYDYCITFSEERRHYWGSRWTWSRCAFMANRYLSPVISLTNLAAIMVTNPSQPFCSFVAVYLGTFSGPLQILLVEIILTLRLYALYGKSRKILLCLLALLLVTTLSSSVIVTMAFGNNHSVVEGIPTYRVCFAQPHKPRSFLWAYWIPIAIFEVVAFFLALYKTKQHINDTKPLRQTEGRRAGGKSLGQQLIEALFRDSLFYFALMSLLVFMGAFLDQFGTETFGVKTIVSTPILSLLSIMGSRLLLSTHQVVTTVFHPTPRTDGIYVLESMFDHVSPPAPRVRVSDRTDISTTLTDLDVDLHLDTLASIGQ